MISVKFGALRDPAGNWLGFDGRPAAVKNALAYSLRLILENDCERPLGQADLALDAVAADAELAARLKVPEGAPLLRVERLTHDKGGQPLDYEFLYFRGDTFQYRFQVGRGPSSVE